MSAGRHLQYCDMHASNPPCLMCRAEQGMCVAHGLEHCILCAAAGLPTIQKLGQPTSDSDKTVYVFWHRRPTDKQAWPVVYQDKGLAESCKFRVGQVVPVRMPALPEGEAKQDQHVHGCDPYNNQAGAQPKQA